MTESTVSGHYRRVGATEAGHPFVLADDGALDHRSLSEASVSGTPFMLLPPPPAPKALVSEAHRC